VGDLFLYQPLSDEIEAVVPFEPRDPVHEGKPLHPPLEGHQLFLERLEAFQTVPDQGCILVLQRSSGRLHLFLEKAKRLPGPPLQESPGQLGSVPILLGVACSAAGAQAASGLGAEAMRCTALSEDLQLVAEEGGHGGRAVPKPQDMGEIPESLGQEPRPGEGAEVASPVGEDPGDREDPGGWLLGDLDEGKAPLPFVLHIVPGAPFLYQAHLRYQGRELVRDVFPGDPPGVPNELRRLLPGLCPEIGEDPALYPD
jgi:hypothetical protein